MAETTREETVEIEQAFIRTRHGVVRFPDKEEALDTLYEKYPRVFNALFALAEGEGIIMLREMSLRFPQEFWLVARASNARLRSGGRYT